MCFNIVDLKGKYKVPLILCEKIAKARQSIGICNLEYFQKVEEDKIAEIFSQFWSLGKDINQKLVAFSNIVAPTNRDRDRTGERKNVTLKYYHLTKTKLFIF